jgi:hypothetical protein
MVGTLVGAFLATVLFSTTVIALPMLAEREVDFVTAMITSIATVVKNPLPMLGFGFIVGVMHPGGVAAGVCRAADGAAGDGACDLASLQTGNVAGLRARSVAGELADQRAGRGPGCRRSNPQAGSRAGR